MAKKAKKEAEAVVEVKPMQNGARAEPEPAKPKKAERPEPPVLELTKEEAIRTVQTHLGDALAILKLMPEARYQRVLNKLGEVMGAVR